MSNIKPIKEIAPKLLKGVKGICICDKCGKTFKPNDTLMEKVDNIQFMGTLGVKAITKGKHTWYLVSPCCKAVHLYGFDIKTKS